MEKITFLVFYLLKGNELRLSNNVYYVKDGCLIENNHVCDMTLNELMEKCSGVSDHDIYLMTKERLFNIATAI